MAYPQELYKDEIYRCVHSDEERDSAHLQGWRDFPEPGTTYKPITAVTPATPKQEHHVGEGDKRPKTTAPDLTTGAAPLPEVEVTAAKPKK